MTGPRSHSQEVAEHKHTEIVSWHVAHALSLYLMASYVVPRLPLLSMLFLLWLGPPLPSSLCQMALPQRGLFFLTIISKKIFKKKKTANPCQSLHPLPLFFFLAVITA